MNLNSERLETHRNEDFIELQLKRNVEEKCMSHGLAWKSLMVAVQLFQVSDF